jgi:hypothetical protein
MIKQSIAAGLMAALFTTNISANTFEVGAAYATGNDLDNITLFGGINLVSQLGVRLEFTSNFSEDEDFFISQDISRYGVFATYTLPLVMGFSVTPKVGMVKTSSSFGFGEVVENIAEYDSTDFAYGLEANYHINESISVFVGYTDYSTDSNLVDIVHDDLDSANYSFGVKVGL